MSGAAITFSVPGQPVGKGRPRVGRAGPHVRLFTPKKTVDYEAKIAAAAAAAMAGREVLAGACAVQASICVAVPASWSKRKRADALAGRVFPGTKPDADNVLKSILDAMNGVVYVDDCQAVDGGWRTRYAEAPGVFVRVTPLEVETTVEAAVLAAKAGLV